MAVAELALGQAHTCALSKDGKVFCWGANADGQLGQGDTRPRGLAAGDMGVALAPVKLPSGRVARSIHAGGDTTCAVLDDGSVRCWGDNEWGQLGTGSRASAIGRTPAELGDNLAAMLVPAGLTVASVDVRSASVCVLATTGDAYCFGLINYGNGVGQNTVYDKVPSPLMFGAGRKLVQISGCGVLETARAVCWGPNAMKNAGVGAIDFLNANSSTPTVDLGGDFAARKAVRVGNARCALSTDGRVKCWGGNSSIGEPRDHGLGHNVSVGTVSTADMGDALPPLDFGTTAKVVDIGSGGHGCALFDDGTVKCWGANARGQLGLGHKAHRGAGPGQMGTALPAVDLGKGHIAKRIAVGVTSHTCAILDDARVKCWGQNTSGQLGIGDARDRGDVPGTMGDALPSVVLRERR